MSELVTLADPQIAAALSNARKRARFVAKQMGAAGWAVETAIPLAMTSLVALPTETLAKLLAADDELDPDEEKTVAWLPTVAERAFAGIPRLKLVRESVRHWHSDVAAEGAALPPLEARIFRAVADFSMAALWGVPEATALEQLRERDLRYDAEILDALSDFVEDAGRHSRVESLMGASLREGMCLVDPVIALDGRLLVAAGQTLSVGLVERLRNFQEHVGIKEPVRMRVKNEFVVA